MVDLFELLYEMREKPNKLFGNRKTLEHLANFIYGYIAGRNGTDIGLDDAVVKFNAMPGGFQDFVVEKYQIPTITQSWCNIIEFHSVSEDEAFDLFFKLLDEFLEKQREVKHKLN